MDIAIVNTPSGLQSWFDGHASSVVHSIVPEPSGYDQNLNGGYTAHPHRFIVAHTPIVGPTGIMKDRVNTFS